MKSRYLIYAREVIKPKGVALSIGVGNRYIASIIHDIQNNSVYYHGGYTKRAYSSFNKALEKLLTSHYPYIKSLYE